MDTLSEEEQQKERKRIEISNELDEIRELIIEEHNKKMNASKIMLTRLIDLYKEKRLEIKDYLPKIKDLLEDGILYIMINVHGSVSYNPKYIKIPDSMVLFKLMTSDYAAVACDGNSDSEYSLYSKIMHEISKNITSRKEKGTRRNNIKFMRKTMKQINPLVNQYMAGSKKHAIVVATNQRFQASKSHIHEYLNGGKIVEKNYSITLEDDDTYNKITVVNKKYKDVNLLHYIDIDIFDTHLRIDMKKIFKLLKKIKYVFIIDQSCSSTDGSTDGSNFLKNKVKHNAEAIEGKSITTNIQEYNNASPYNTNSVYERELENKEENNEENNSTKFNGFGNPMNFNSPNRSPNITRRNQNYSTRPLPPSRPLLDWFSRKNERNNVKINLQTPSERKRLKEEKRRLKEEAELEKKRVELEKKRVELEKKRVEEEKKRVERSEESRRKFEAKQKKEKF